MQVVCEVYTSCPDGASPSGGWCRLLWSPKAVSLKARPGILNQDMTDNKVLKTFWLAAGAFIARMTGNVTATAITKKIKIFRLQPPWTMSTMCHIVFYLSTRCRSLGCRRQQRHGEKLWKQWPFSEEKENQSSSVRHISTVPKMLVSLAVER